MYWIQKFAFSYKLNGRRWHGRRASCARIYKDKPCIRIIFTDHMADILDVCNSEYRLTVKWRLAWMRDYQISIERKPEKETERKNGVKFCDKNSCWDKWPERIWEVLKRTNKWVLVGCWRRRYRAFLLILMPATTTSYNRCLFLICKVSRQSNDISLN